MSEKLKLRTCDEKVKKNGVKKWREKVKWENEREKLEGKKAVRKWKEIMRVERESGAIKW